MTDKTDALIAEAVEQIRRETTEACARLELNKQALASMYDDDHSTAKSFDLMANTFSFFDPNKG